MVDLGVAGLGFMVDLGVAGLGFMSLYLQTEPRGDGNSSA